MSGVNKKDGKASKESLKFLGAASFLLTSGFSGPSRKWCRLCEEPIVPPQGFRVTPGGPVHGKCAVEAELRREH